MNKQVLSLRDFSFVVKKNPLIQNASCFWAMDDAKALRAEIIVEHNNVNITRAIVVQERTKVEVLESFDADGNKNELPKITTRWVFKGYEVDAQTLELIKETFKDKKLKGLAQPSPEFVD